MKSVLVLAAGILLTLMIGLSIFLFTRSGIPSGSFPLKVGSCTLKEGPAKRQTSPDTYAAVYDSINKIAIVHVVAVFPSAAIAAERMKTTTTGFERDKSDFEQIGQKIVRTYYN